MATQVSRSRARHRQSRSHRRSRWVYMGLVILGCIGLVLVARPRMSLAASRTALSTVVLHGWGVHIVAASVAEPAGPSDPLRVTGDALWPTRPLPSGRLVHVHVEVAGLGGWQRQRVFAVTTPATPRIVSRRLSVDVGHGPTATFTTAVAQVRVLPSGHVLNSRERTHVTLGPAVQVPNQHGTVALQVRARLWERWSPLRTVQWASVPWLSATASLATAGHPNFATAPLTVTFSAPVRRAQVAHWTIAPAVAGAWHQVTNRTWQFQPTGRGWAPAATIHVSLPSDSSGPEAVDGASLARTSQSLTVQVAQGTTLRLQQWLAELGYLPVTWTSSSAPAASGWDSVFQPPAGHFTWRYAHVPTALRAEWNPTYWTAMTQAAVIAFQYQEHLPVNGVVTSPVWAALQQAAQEHAVSSTPYAYVYVSETLPERLWLWVGGHVVLTTLANTGIPQDQTILGSYAVDERQTFQIMRGKNPNGTRYADPVHWINYFNKSQAVHGFLRAQYGFPQSLGCVEVPIPVAKKIYPYLYIGALVTVAGPGSAPLVPPPSQTPSISRKSR